MKNNFLAAVLFFFAATQAGLAQDSVTDYDGNTYHTVAIGTQIWLRENLQSLHYSDGTEIPDVVSYDNSDSLAALFGRLYTWDAAMKNSVVPGSQGVCPGGWHVPTSGEYTILEDFLGGAAVAGGKMKDTTIGMWLYSSAGGATNSSGFTGLPGGEYDAHQYMRFQLLHTYGVFWTSTQTGTLKATERYLEYNSPQCIPYDWFKTMKYSIRCVRDAGVGLKEPSSEKDFVIFNPVREKIQFSTGCPERLVKIEIYDVQGRLCLAQKIRPDISEIDAEVLKPGSYLVKVFFTDQVITRKIIML